MEQTCNLITTEVKTGEIPGDRSQTAVHSEFKDTIGQLTIFYFLEAINESSIISVNIGIYLC